MKKITTIMMMVMALVAANNATLKVNAQDAGMTCTEFVSAFDEQENFEDVINIDDLERIVNAIHDASNEHYDGVSFTTTTVLGGVFTDVDTLVFYDLKTRSGKKIIVYYNDTKHDYVQEGYINDVTVAMVDVDLKEKDEEDIYWFN